MFTVTADKMHWIEAPYGDQLIFSTPGEFYSYGFVFTTRRPVFALLDCRANKGLSPNTIHWHDEANLYFTFEPARICSVEMANYLGYVSQPDNNCAYGKTLVTPAGMGPQDFYRLRDQNDIIDLKLVCDKAFEDTTDKAHLVSLSVGAVIAVKTQGGIQGQKYGLFVIRGIVDDAIQIDACHTLL
ncbi:MAG: hypothetical protein BRC23_02205 [Parcubacteria group bacterium SW_4_49_11]|nr:MAG: hypothetical protein BRC23_02205 [Parcubacteria group bacterium SW_4_49_11]